VTGLGFVLRMAAREVRASRRRLLLLTGSVAIGVAALVAIGSFTENLRDSVRTQARGLLGADLAFSSRRPLPDRAEAVIDSLAAGGAGVARLTNFAGMAYVPRTSGTRLVQVAAVEGGYPFYGEVRTDPGSAWGELRQGGRIVVDPSLLTALGARVGDSLALGEARFVISGSIVSAPGNVGLRTAFGPRVYISARDLAATRLLGFGARAEYEAFVRLGTTLWAGSPDISGWSGSSPSCSAGSASPAPWWSSSGSGSIPSPCCAAWARAPGWSSRFTPSKRPRWA
jgi:putative ABC transport system permease protein